MPEPLLDAAGRRRSPATMPEFHAGRPPRNKGMRYPADPPTVEEIVTVMRYAGNSVHGRRLRGLIVVLWRAGLRIHEALALTQHYLARKRSEGKTGLEAMRCLKRHPTRRVWHLLQPPNPEPGHPHPPIS